MPAVLRMCHDRVQGCQSWEFSWVQGCLLFSGCATTGSKEFWNKCVELAKLNKSAANNSAVVLTKPHAVTGKVKELACQIGQLLPSCDAATLATMAHEHVEMLGYRVRDGAHEADEDVGGETVAVP